MTTDNIENDILPTALEPKKASKLRSILSGFILTFFSLAFSILMIEIFVRVGFDFLPPSMQGDIQHVRRVPWNEERLVQPFPFVIDNRFQARLDPGIKDYPIHWRDAKFTFSTGTVWDGHVVGLRTDGPQWPLQVLAFGDSFTFCWTEVNDCWVQRLQNDYGWNSVNAGLAGTGSTGQMALIEDIGPALQPELVIWQWYPNDLSDDYVLANIQGKTGTLEGAPGPDAIPDAKGLAQYSAVYTLLKKWLDPPKSSNSYKHYVTREVNGRDMLVTTNEYPSGFSMTYPLTQYGWERNVEAHEAGASFIQQEIGAEMLLVLLPTKEEAYAEYLIDELGEAYIDEIGESRRILMALCKEKDWRCIDMLPVFQEAIRNGETIYYALDFHLDASGNRLLAETLHDYIVENGLLDTFQ